MLSLPLPSSGPQTALPASLAGAAVHELRGPPGSFAQIAFVVLLLAAGENAAQTPVFWVSTAQNAYPPGIAWLGLDPGRILFAQARDDAECLGSLETALRGGMAGIAEAAQISRLAARRLALAARQGNAIGFLLRHASRQTAQDSTAFTTRWFIEPTAEGGLKAELLYAKAGRPGVFFYEIQEGSDDNAPPALIMVSSGTEQPEQRRATG
jgi:protein ImuA